jgi:hypothetical protein
LAGPSGRRRTNLPRLSVGGRSRQAASAQPGSVELPLETLAGRRRLDGKTEKLQQVDSPSLPTVDKVFQSIKLLQHFIKHQTSDRSDITIAIVEGIEGKNPERPTALSSSIGAMPNRAAGRPPLSTVTQTRRPRRHASCKRSTAAPAVEPDQP